MGWHLLSLRWGSRCSEDGLSPIPGFLSQIPPVAQSLLCKAGVDRLLAPLGNISNPLYSGITEGFTSVSLCLHFKSHVQMVTLVEKLVTWRKVPGGGKDTANIKYILSLAIWSLRLMASSAFIPRVCEVPLPSAPSSAAWFVNNARTGFCETAIETLDHEIPYPNVCTEFSTLTYLWNNSSIKML